MIISVINCSGDALPDEEVQRVLRAINRQIAEDFAGYWSLEATLRLEGKARPAPDPTNPIDMRGDAVLYLWNDVDEVEDALGYHDRNHQGIPYGFVFLDICAELNEPWSVTLSHEALELLLDPEVNLLVAGPHPADPSREVFHWYEACDAVQAQTYEIDHVKVSNFVLPLYFTGGEEQGGRNDFLGARGEGDAPLPSFGVAPGGYVGFYDPLLGEHDTFAQRGDDYAALRVQVKGRARLARRAVRYHRTHLGRPGLSQVEAVIGQVDDTGPWFECVRAEVKRGATVAAVQQRVRRRMGRGWKCVEAEGRPPALDVLRTSREANAGLSAAEAWEAAYAVGRVAGVRHAEPLFCGATPGFAVEDAPEVLPAGRRAARGGGRPEAEWPAPTWSLDETRVPEAWALQPPAGGAQQGEGIVVAHPDTGYTPHPEVLENGGTRIVAEYDFLGRDRDATDPLRMVPFAASPGHGTGTSSVILSAEGHQGGTTYPPNRYVTGVAPQAKLMPLRVTSSVVLWSMRTLIDAVRYARAHGAHVMSISLGGLFRSRLLERELAAAVDDGIIVLAAAGNVYPRVVYPAKYADVIAVAACDPDRNPWKDSAAGPQVDVTAPGADVWRALVTDGRNGPQYDVRPSDGTSYAVATTAGIAALWLAFHGRTALLERYRRDGRALVDAFRTVLKRRISDREPNWETEHAGYGTGIVDARNVLAAAVPARSRAGARRSAGQRKRDSGGVEPALAPFVELFPQLPVRELQRGLRRLFGCPQGELARRLQDVGDELAFTFTAEPAAAARFARECRAGASFGGRAARRDVEERARHPFAAARVSRRLWKAVAH